jgi:hypothetical protein
VRQAWLAKVDLVVDQSWKKNQLACIDNLVGMSRRRRVNRSDFPSA